MSTGCIYQSFRRRVGNPDGVSGTCAYQFRTAAVVASAREASNRGWLSTVRSNLQGIVESGGEAVHEMGIGCHRGHERGFAHLAPFWEEVSDVNVMAIDHSLGSDTYPCSGSEA